MPHARPRSAHRRFRFHPVLLALLAGAPAAAQPVGTDFTFQGELRSGGSTVTTAADFQFRLYDAAFGGSQQGAQLAASNLTLANGRFTVDLDFGAVFAGSSRLLEIDVRSPAGSGAFVTLAPRQPLSGGPYSQFALNSANAALAGNAANLNGQGTGFYTNASNLTSGTIPSARFGGTYSNAISLTNPANVLSGNGAGLTNLSASQLATGFITLSGSNPALHIIRGDNTNASADSDGVIGSNTAGAASAYGVRGNHGAHSTRQPSAGAGVYGDSSAGVGAAGFTDTNIGVMAIANDAVAANTGLQAQTFSPAGWAAKFLGRVTMDTRLGIGTATPLAHLHVFDSASGVTPNAASMAVIERNANNYLSLLTPAANENGVLFGTSTDAQDGGIVFNNPAAAHGLQFRTGGNATKLTITAAGDVGIGSVAPPSQLTVYEPGDNSIQTTFTQDVAAAGLNIATDFVAGNYTPGVFWSTTNNNPTNPKAGIYLRELSAGTEMHLGTSNSFATGITNDALVLDQSGNVKVGGSIIIPTTHRQVSVSGGAFSNGNGTRTRIAFIDGFNKILVEPDASVAAGAAVDAYAPVQLPQGAVISDFSALTDDTDTQNLVINLWRQSLTTGAVDIVAAANSAGTSGRTTINATSINFPNVDNTAFAYVLRFSANGRTVNTNRLSLYLATIEYDVTTPLN